MHNEQNATTTVDSDFPFGKWQKAVHSFLSTTGRFGAFNFAHTFVVVAIRKPDTTGYY